MAMVSRWLQGLDRGQAEFNLFVVFSTPKFRLSCRLGLCIEDNVFI